MRYYVEPRSREWFELRIGRVTSTRMKTVAHGTLAAQTKLLDEMQWEVDHREEALDLSMSGFGYKTPASIKLGREREDWMLARYEILMQQRWGRKPTIDRPGFIVHASIPEFGASPDWLEVTGTTDFAKLQHRVCEGKTRVDHRKHEYAMTAGLLPEDKDQVYCEMMCAGMRFTDYISYCPDYPALDTRIVIVEVELDQIYANFLYAELNRFLKHFRAGTRPTVPKGHSAVPGFFD